MSFHIVLTMVLFHGDQVVSFHGEEVVSFHIVTFHGVIVELNVVTFQGIEVVVSFHHPVRFLAVQHSPV